MSKNKELNKDLAIEEILDRISKGESLRSVLPQDNRPTHLPAAKTFLEWVAFDEALSKQYTRARELRADVIFDEMIEIADDGSNDLMTITKGLTEYETENKEVVNRSRLRIDTRKWILSKMNPKKYGDSLKLSGDSESPLDVIIQGKKFAESDENKP